MRVTSFKKSVKYCIC